MNYMNLLDGLKLPALKAGAHESPGDGMCAMELVAFMERLPHSDSPPCTCPVIAAYVRALNDRVTDDERQRLLPYLPRLVGTVSKDHEQERGEMAAWRAIKVFAPMALEKSSPKHAKILRYFDQKKGLKAAVYAARAAAAKSAYRVASYAASRAASYAASAAAHCAAFAAAHAAHAAVSAAVHAAVHASDAAAYATSYPTDRKPVIDAALQLLDDMLAVGPQGKWTKEQEGVKALEGT